MYDILYKGTVFLRFYPQFILFPGTYLGTFAVEEKGDSFFTFIPEGFKGPVFTGPGVTMESLVIGETDDDHF